MVSVAVLIAVGGCAGADIGDQDGEALGEQQESVINGSFVVKNTTGSVAIYWNTEMMCSGTYVGNGWVLTAAHCTAVGGRPEQIWGVGTVTPGSVLPSWQVLPAGTWAWATRIRLEPQGQDVALLKMSQPYDESRVPAMRNRHTSAPSLANETLWCPGYGYNSVAGGYGRLLGAYLPVLEYKPGYFVLGKNQKNQITFFGDSGGGCFKFVNGVNYLVSVNDSVNSQANPTKAFATAVTTDMPWADWLRNTILE